MEGLDYSSEVKGSEEKEEKDKDESLLKKKYVNLKLQYLSVYSSECTMKKNLRQLESEMKEIKKESQ